MPAARMREEVMVDHMRALRRRGAPRCSALRKRWVGSCDCRGTVGRRKKMTKKNMEQRFGSLQERDETREYVVKLLIQEGERWYPARIRQRSYAPVKRHRM